MLGKSPRGVWLQGRTFSIKDLRSWVCGYYLHLLFQSSIVILWVLVSLVASGGSAWSASAGEFSARLLTALMAANGLVVVGYVCICVNWAFGTLAGSQVTSSDEVCPSGPITLYGFWIKRMYTVPVSVGWRRHYSPTFPNNGIGGCKLLFISPVR
ncbi:unnamed protein product [Brassica oleracea]